MNTLTTITIGLISTSDRASSGVYADEGIPALKSWLDKAVLNPIRYVEALIPDDQDEIKSVLKHWAAYVRKMAASLYQAYSAPFLIVWI